MRVTNMSVSRQLIFEISRNYDRMNLYRLQVSSGKQINDFDDNPRAVALLKRFDALQANNAQYERNVGAARSYLEATDSALQDMSEVIVNLRELVMNELGPLSNASSRESGAIAVEGMREALLALANQQVQGGYLFSGYRTGTQPFSLVSGQVSYNGDANSQSVQVGPTLRLDVTTPGSEFMGSSSSVLAGSAELRPRITGATPLADLNGGAGVGTGSIVITAGGQAPQTIDLSSATTVQDVLDAINALSPGVTATINGDESGLTISGSAPMSIGEVSGGSTAGDLGVLGTTEGAAVIGRPISPELTNSTDLSTIRSLDGQLPLGVLRIVRANEITEIDLSGATTVGEMRNAIQSLMPDMDLEIDGGGLVLRFGRPEPFSVESPAGDQTSSLLGLTGETSPARTFDLFSDVMEALRSDDQRSLRQTLIELEDVHNKLLSLNVTVGSRQTTLDQNEMVLRERKEGLALERSRVEDVDLINVATRLTFAETTYQASLASAAGVFNMTLLNYI